MDFDVAIIGAGPAGMVAMLRLAEAGLQVVGIEPFAPKAIAEDLRSTAFLMPAVNVLERANIWSKLRGDAAALVTMEIIDALQNPQQSVAFNPSEIGHPQFGFNIQNAALRQILNDAVNAHPNIDMRYGTPLTAARQFADFVELQVGDARIKTRLLVGADGRNSAVRAMLGIDVKRHNYDQSAIVVTVTHDHPHANISTEVHATGGPFTTVPIANIDDQPASAIVWLDTPERIAFLAQATDADFEDALNARSFGVRGAIQVASARANFPMILQTAGRVHDHRAVLIGEAAHVVPPIGAQGLNMSLKDIESLARAISTGALAHPRQLDSWARHRLAEIALRKTGIDALNRISIAGFSGAVEMRKYGLSVLERPSAVRRGIMRLGLG